MDDQDKEFFMRQIEKTYELITRKYRNNKDVMICIQHDCGIEILVKLIDIVKFPIHRFYYVYADKFKSFIKNECHYFNITESRKVYREYKFINNSEYFQA